MSRQELENDQRHYATISREMGVRLPFNLGGIPRWKRTLDLVCLVLLAPAWLPLMLLIAVLVRLSSSGPVLFRQERIGFRGQPFTILKFRTMRHAAETQSHAAYLQQLIKSDAPMKKLDGEDNRVLAIGVLLRASGLDELPQLLNVFRGEMSLVGPRPCIRYEYEQYSPEHRERVNAFPGLTGLWQVSGKNKTTFHQMVELDIAYARHLSLTQDISILLRTFPVLVEQVIEMRNKKRRPAVKPKLRPREVHDTPTRTLTSV